MGLVSDPIHTVEAPAPRLLTEGGSLDDWCQPHRKP